jgi:hypothetical protein
MAYRALRSPSLPHAVFGGVFIGTAVVYMNLAQSVVDMPVMALQFSIFLAFMVYAYETCRQPKDESPPREIAVQSQAVPPTQPVTAGAR